MKILIGAANFIISLFFGFIWYRITRSFIVGGIVFVILVVSIKITWKRGEKKYYQYKTRSNKPKGKHVYDLDNEGFIKEDITPFSSSIVISQKGSSTVAVCILENAVREFENMYPDLVADIPLYMACQALNLSDEKIQRMLRSNRSYTVTIIKASERDLTRLWGTEKVCYILINA